MTKIKCDFKVFQARNPDVPQKFLSERSHSYVIDGNLKERSCKSIQRGWLKTVPLKFICEPQ